MTFSCRLLVLQSFEHSSGTSGAGSVERRRQMSHYPRPLHHLTRVSGLEESQAAAAEAARQRPAD